MPIRITAATHQDSLSGSPEKRLDVAPDGTMWLAVADGGKIRFFASRDAGSTWAVSGTSDLSYGSGQTTAVPSFWIDADGYAHVSFVRWQVSPQTVTYARGTPKTGGGWTWKTLTLSPAGGRTGVDSDVIAFRNGTGWVAWVTWGLGSSGGSRVSQINISPSGVLTVGATVHGPSGGDGTYQFASLVFAHTGGGRIQAVEPHLFLTVAHQAGAAPVYAHRGRWESGSWSWESPVQLDASSLNPHTVLCSVHDGTRLVAAWSSGNSTIKASEWPGTGGATARNPPALPGGFGVVKGISLSVDPATADIHLVAYDATDGDVITAKFTRGTLTWSAWTVVVARSANSQDGDVQLVRHPPLDSVDLVYATGNSPAIELWHTRLAVLVRAPEAPRLISPAHGARVDLAAGATFRWEYVPIGPGDVQQAWQFRRIFSSTTEYWNAATQTFSGTATWNPSDAAAPAQAVFPSGKWTTGTTYAWSVRTRSASGADSAWAPDRTVIASLAPTVIVTAPLGIVYATSTPLVTWTYTSAQAQRDYEVRIVPITGAVIDPDDPGPITWGSGVIASAVARSHRVGSALSVSDPTSVPGGSGGASGTGSANPGGSGAGGSSGGGSAFSVFTGTYRAYVRATDALAVASSWAYADFTLSPLTPPGPSLTAVDFIDYTTGVSRVRLMLTGRSNHLAADQAGGAAGWSVEANAAVAAVTDDALNQILAGVSVTSQAAGDVRIITSVGSPPEAPLGEAALSGPLDFPVLAGQDYTALASLKAAGPDARAGRLAIRWYDGDDGTGALLSTSTGQQVAVTNATYATAQLTATAPAGAMLARLVVEILATTAAAEVFYLARVSLAPGRDTGWRPGGLADTQTVRIERQVGEDWVTLAARTKTDYWQQATVEDRSMPLGVPVRYRAYTDVDTGDGATLSSEVSLSATVTVDSPAWAIRDEAEDEAEVLALVTEHTRTDDDGAVVSYPAGRTYAVVDVENVRGGSGELTLFVAREQFLATLSVLRRAVPLIVQSPVGEVFTLRALQRDYESQWRADRLITVSYVLIAGGD